MNDTPFPTHGNEVLEARIVSWVLGEASPFEAAELERLCDERPELLAFKRRMQTLHGLLVEAEAPIHEDSWKLSAERRRVLEEKIGEEMALHSSELLEKRVRSLSRRAWWGIAACLVLTVVISALLGTGSVNPRTVRSIEKTVAFISASDGPAEPKSSEVSNQLEAKGVKSELAAASPQTEAALGLEPGVPAAPALASGGFQSKDADVTSDARMKEADEQSTLADAGLLRNRSLRADSRFAIGSVAQTPGDKTAAVPEETSALAALPDGGALSKGMASPPVGAAALPADGDALVARSSLRTTRETESTLARRDEAENLPVIEGAKRAAILPKSKPAVLTGTLKPSTPELRIEDSEDLETSTAEDPFSTFSLNVSDASFQVAQAAIAKGERPDAASVKVEQFYNAVDYGDPSPASGEPMSLRIEQCGHPVVPGRNLVRIALKTAAAGRSAAQPLRLTLLVDQSGSMVREDRREAMDKALADLGSLLTAKDVVNVIGFSRTPRLLADALPGDKAGNLAALVNQSAGEGGTNLEEALRLGEQLALRSRLNGARNRIVLFTDGAANLGNADPAKLAEKVGQLRQKGIAFDIAGIAADGLNDELLGELARHGDGRYHVVGKAGDGGFAKQLAGAFSPAAENVKVQVRFNPERVARYRLIGFEKDRLRTEDFRNDAVDAAELAAEEAGVAIYQVEPLPGGKGELGEVSVRFLDTAERRMVERSWTIPNEAATPALDRAAPSMQLAVLSMLAAEKLRGGPLADAIDFNNFAKSAAEVRRFYGDEGRPAEMLRLIEVLK